MPFAWRKGDLKMKTILLIFIQILTFSLLSTAFAEKPPPFYRGAGPLVVPPPQKKKHHKFKKKKQIKPADKSLAPAKT